MMRYWSCRCVNGQEINSFSHFGQIIVRYCSPLFDSFISHKGIKDMYFHVVSCTAHFCETLSNASKTCDTNFFI